MNAQKQSIHESTVEELISEYRKGLRLALEGTGTEIERYLPSISSMRNLVRSLVFANRITPEGELAIYKILDRLRYGILSNNSAEKYDAKAGIVSGEDFAAKLRELIDGTDR